MGFTIEYRDAPNYVLLHFDKPLLKREKDGQKLTSTLVFDGPNSLERLRVSPGKVETADHLNFEKLLSYIQALFEIPGLKVIVVNFNWISLSRHSDIQWEDIIPKVEKVLQGL